jgi:hypothetical protein
MVTSEDGFTWQLQTTTRLESGDHIGMSLTPDDIHIMHRS